MTWQYLASFVQKPGRVARSGRFCLHPCPLVVPACSGTSLLCSVLSSSPSSGHRHCIASVIARVPQADTDFFLFSLTLYDQHYCFFPSFAFKSSDVPVGIHFSQIFLFSWRGFCFVRAAVVL